MLLGLPLSVRGKYYVETEPKDWNAYELAYDGSPKASRPFYVLVFRSGETPLGSSGGMCWITCRLAPYFMRVSRPSD